ncbi:MAG: endolytic transglycosylase MltG [Candidatus Vogelbacteria bacterium]|nr:endolytic transglycosylase MltG [Candidatus Vogelbacteria bacterium]
MLAPKVPEIPRSKFTRVCSSVGSCLKAAALEAEDDFADWQHRHLKNATPHWKAIWAGSAAVLLWLTGLYLAFFSAPIDFPAGTIVRIRKGSTVSSVATGLYENRLIKYPTIFKILARLGGGDKVVAGDYKFERSAGVINVYERLARGVYGIDPTRVTIYEGHSVREVAELLDKSLPTFEREKFIEAANGLEGRLFPDTYLIRPMDDEQDIVRMMSANFDQKLLPLESQIGRSGHSRDEIITMASIIELEARTAESRRIISGILWNRIRKGMKLQVDVVFPYIMGKYSLQLTQKDLQFDSPYNTYRYKGLPPGAIGSPGLDSILAALEPTKTDDLYYLSDRSGNMYYAKTYKQHMDNRSKHLGS